MESKKTLLQHKSSSFFSGANQTGMIDGIGFVTQAAFSRLTPTQKYIFDAVLSIFGKDIVDNIFLMATFADAYIPTVLEATRVANIPYKESFKFNNSALFASNDSSDSQFNSMFWDMGYASFGSFFDHFSRAEPRSLDLTREVLKEREQLETLIPGLQEQVRVGLTQFDAIQQDEKALKAAKVEERRNREFQIEITEDDLSLRDEQIEQEKTDFIAYDKVEEEDLDVEHYFEERKWVIKQEQAIADLKKGIHHLRNGEEASPLLGSTQSVLSDTTLTKLEQLEDRMIMIVNEEDWLLSIED